MRITLSAVEEFGEVRGRDLIKSIAMDGMEETYCKPDNTFIKRSMIEKLA